MCDSERVKQEATRKLCIDNDIIMLVIQRHELFRVPWQLPTHKSSGWNKGGGGGGGEHLGLYIFIPYCLSNSGGLSVIYPCFSADIPLF